VNYQFCVCALSDGRPDALFRLGYDQAHWGWRLDLDSAMEWWCSAGLRGYFGVDRYAAIH